MPTRRNLDPREGDMEFLWNGDQGMLRGYWLLWGTERFLGREAVVTAGFCVPGVFAA